MQRKWFAVAVCALLVAGFIRYVHSAVLAVADPLSWHTLPDQLKPLLDYMWRGRSMAQSIATLTGVFRYGPVLYLVTAPIAAVTRSLQNVHVGVAVAGHVCFWLSLFLIDRRLFASCSWSIRLLVVAVALNFTPALETMHCACLDTWEMLSIIAGFFLFTSPSRWLRRLSAVPVVAGILTKLMPMLVLLFMFVRRKVTAVTAAATALVILAAGQLLFGSEMGFEFPLRAFRVLVIFGTKWAPVWWENDSVRGLIYKALTGFVLPRGQLYMDVAPQVRHVVDPVMSLGGVLFLLLVAINLWRWPASATEEVETLRILGGFSSAIIVHHLIIPYSTPQYLPSTLLAYAFLLACAIGGFMTRAETGAALVSLILIGTIVPKTILVRLLGLGRLNALLGSALHFDAGQMYTFYGFPGIGVILLGIVVLRLQSKLMSESPRISHVILPDSLKVGPSRHPISAEGTVLTGS